MLSVGPWLSAFFRLIPAFIVFAFPMSVLRRPEGKRPVPSRKYPLRSGRAYVVRERTPDHVFRALLEAMQNGQAGLIVSRSNPRALREDFDLGQTPILWLTEAVGPDCVSPTDLAKLEGLVRSFANRREVVVAMVGIEYLSRRVGADRSQWALESLRDVITSVGGNFLVSLDESEVDGSLLAFFDREFEPLPVPRSKGYTVVDVFVIDAAGGILLSHSARRSSVEIDVDVMASMLTVIMDFAKVSFADGFDQLRGLELGNKTVVLERGNRLILAVVFTGREPPKLRSEMRAFAGRLEDRFGDLLDRWSGSMAEIRDVEAMAQRAFFEGRESSPSSP